MCVEAVCISLSELGLKVNEFAVVICKAGMLLVAVKFHGKVGCCELGENQGYVG